MVSSKGVNRAGGQVPVQLKNNILTKPLNMVTEMYSLPAYGTLDPNPLQSRRLARDQPRVFRTSSTLSAPLAWHTKVQ